MSLERNIIEGLFFIADKEGQHVPFRLNAVQRQLDDNLTGRDVVPKARQRGVSSYVLGLYLARCLMYRNRRCVVVSHDVDSTQRLLQKVHYMIKYMHPKPVCGYKNRNEISFDKMDSVFYIGTAGSRDFGHGDTITDFHGSEVARWSEPQELLKGVFNAVPPSGHIILESTGNGVGNYYHRLCRRAVEGGGYRLHFFSWLDADEYKMEFASEIARQEFMAQLRPDLDEPTLAERGLSAEQLKWRRVKIEEMDYDLPAFKEQYPLSLHECFQASGYSYFHEVRFLQDDALWRRVSAELRLWGGHPLPRLRYVIGADVGGGVGQNNSCLHIACLDTMEQVGEWTSNRKEPDEVGVVLWQLARQFNNAYVNVERNNHGLLTIAQLLRLYDPARLHRSSIARQEDSTEKRLSRFGTLTTESSRERLIVDCRHRLSTDYTIHSPDLKGECDTFVETESGKIEAQRGCLDDRVLACAMATHVFARAQLVLREHYEQKNVVDLYDPTQLDSAIAELEQKANAYPIAFQDGVV